MNRSDSVTKLAPALVKAQGELRAIAKDRQNDHFRNKYATLDAITDTVRPILAAHGLAIVQGAASPTFTADGALKSFAIDTMLLHESGEWLSNTVTIPVAKSDPQGAVACCTYGRRAGLSALLALSTEDDDDGNTASRAPKAASQAAKPRTQTASHSTRSAGEATPAPSTNGRAKEPEYKMFKGKALKDYDTPELERLLKWAREKGHEDLSDAMASVLANRALGEDPDSKADRQVEKVKAAVAKEDAALPF